MTFWDHLGELRSCLAKIIVTIAVFSLLFFLFGLRRATLFGYEIFYPFPDMTNNIANLVFLQIKNDLLPSDLELFPMRLMDPVLINVQISLFLGVVCATPMIYYQLGKFIGPGLFPHEKRSLKLVTLPATFLFILGCLFAYFLLIPFLIRFMYMYIESMDTMRMVSIADFVSFVLMITLAFGIIFELPIFMIGFTKIGLVSADFWRRHWRAAAILIALLGAAITPDGSGITMMIVALPMWLLYLIGYIGARAVQARKVKV